MLWRLISSIAAWFLGGFSLLWQHCILCAGALVLSAHHQHHTLLEKKGRKLTVGMTSWLAQPDKTLIAVRGKFVDRQDHCTAFWRQPMKEKQAPVADRPLRNSRMRFIRTDESQNPR
jgi:hypothetical protein